MKTLENAFKLPATRKEKTYLPFDKHNLKDFAQRCSKACKDNQIDEIFVNNFIQNFNRHFRPGSEDLSSTKVALDEVLIRFSAIDEMLKDPQLPADKKTSIALKIDERIGQCTGGFLIGLQEITSEITGSAFEIDAMLYSIRYSLCEKVAFQLSGSNVHKHNIVFIVAKELGYGVNPLLEREKDGYYEAYVTNYPRLIPSFEEAIRQSFQSNYHLPYIFSYIMDEVMTVYDSEVKNGTLSIEGATTIKSALKQLLPALKNLEETAEQAQKEYLQELKELRNQREKLLKPFGFEEQQQDYFQTGWTYSQEQLQMLKAELVALEAQKTNIPITKKMQLTLDISSLTAKIAVYEKILQHAQLLTDTLKQEYETLTVSIQNKQANPPPTVDDIIFLTNEDTGQQSLNIKKIRELLWQELWDKKYFELSKEEKENYACIFNINTSTSGINKAIKFFSKAEDVQLLAMNLNAFQRILPKKSFEVFLKETITRHWECRDFLKLIQLIHLESEFYPGIFKKFFKFLIEDAHVINELIKSQVTNEKIMLFLENIQINPRTNIIKTLKLCHGFRKELIIPLLNKFEKANQLFPSQYDLIIYLYPFDSPEIHDQIVAWYVAKKGELSQQFIEDYIKGHYHRSKEDAKTFYRLFAFLKNNPKIKIKIQPEHIQFIKHFYERFPHQIQSFELEIDDLIDFCLTGDLSDISEISEIIHLIITKDYLEKLKLHVDGYQIILPYFLKNINEKNLSAILRIDNCNKALELLDNRIIDDLLGDGQVKFENKKLILQSLSDEKIKALFDIDIKNFINHSSLIKPAIIEREQCRKALLIKITERDNTQLFLDNLSIQQSFTHEEKFSIYFDLISLQTQQKEYFIQKYLWPVVSHQENDTIICQIIKKTPEHAHLLKEFSRLGPKTFQYLSENFNHFSSTLINSCHTYRQFEIIRPKKIFTPSELEIIYQKLSPSDQIKFLKDIKDNYQDFYSEKLFFLNTPQKEFFETYESWLNKFIGQFNLSKDLFTHEEQNQKIDKILNDIDKQTRFKSSYIKLLLFGLQLSLLQFKNIMVTLPSSSKFSPFKKDLLNLISLEHVDNEMIITWMNHIKPTFPSRNISIKLLGTIQAMLKNNRTPLINEFLNLFKELISSDILIEILKTPEFIEEKEKFYEWSSLNNIPVQLETNAIENIPENIIKHLLEIDQALKIETSPKIFLKLHGFLNTNPQLKQQFILNKRDFIQCCLFPQSFEIYEIDLMFINESYINHLSLTVEEKNQILPFLLEHFNEKVLDKLLNSLFKDGYGFEGLQTILDTKYLAKVIELPEFNIQWEALATSEKEKLLLKNLRLDKDLKSCYLLFQKLPNKEKKTFILNHGTFLYSLSIYLLNYLDTDFFIEFLKYMPNQIFSMNSRNIQWGTYLLFTQPEIISDHSEVYLELLKLKSLDRKLQLLIIKHAKIENLDNYVKIIPHLLCELINDKKTRNLFKLSTIEIILQLENTEEVLFEFIQTVGFKMFFDKIKKEEQQRLIHIHPTLFMKNKKVTHIFSDVLKTMTFDHLEQSKLEEFPNFLDSSQFQTDQFISLAEEHPHYSIFQKIKSSKTSQDQKIPILGYFKQMINLAEKGNQKEAMEALTQRFINDYQNPPLYLYQHLLNFFIKIFYIIGYLKINANIDNFLITRNNEITKKIEEIHSHFKKN